MESINRFVFFLFLDLDGWVCFALGCCNVVDIDFLKLGFGRVLLGSFLPGEGEILEVDEIESLQEGLRLSCIRVVVSLRVVDVGGFPSSSSSDRIANGFWEAIEKKYWFEGVNFGDVGASNETVRGAAIFPSVLRL